MSDLAAIESAHWISLCVYDGRVFLVSHFSFHLEILTATPSCFFSLHHKSTYQKVGLQSTSLFERVWLINDIYLEIMSERVSQHEC